MTSLSRYMAFHANGILICSSHSLTQFNPRVCAISLLSTPPLPLSSSYNPSSTPLNPSKRTPITTLKLTSHPLHPRGKGTPRRKVKKVHKTSGTDDKKLQTSLKKLNVQPIQAIEEVNMFKEDGNVIHFAAPKGTHISPSHTKPPSI